MRKVLSLLLIVGLLALAACGVKSTNTPSENQAAAASDTVQVLKGAAILAAAVASTPLPPEVAITPAGKAITYWSQYGAAIAPALAEMAGSPNPTAAP